MKSKQKTLTEEREKLTEEREPKEDFETNFEDKWWEEICDVFVKGTTAFKCENKACYWGEFEEDVDWGFYSKDEGNCDSCQLLCEADKECGAVECGSKYCSWWKRGKC